MTWPLDQAEARKRRYEKTQDCIDEGGADPPDDEPRSVAQSDRDKLIYSSFLRRLAAVTQVVGAREGHIFHNRLTHTLKVAQLGQRLAERLIEINEPLAERLSIDATVTEAAALAHDLGHPPFGHVAEQELCRLIDEWTKRRVEDERTREGKAAQGRESETPCSDGFEGNAQSFRIITRLAVHKPHVQGLNLSRGTLNAVLKYPWFREPRDLDEAKNAKWGAYRSDSRDFAFVRSGLPEHQRTVEAEIMDVADDIAYSVHDLDDFMRAGLVPLADLLHRGDAENSSTELGDRERTRFVEWWKKSKYAPDPGIAEKDVETLFVVLSELYADQSYRGEYQQRGLARRVTSSWIQEMMEAVTLQDPDNNDGKCLAVGDPIRLRLAFLKGLVWYYVIESGKLATQRRGQRQIVRGLFEIYLEAVRKRDEESEALIPNRFLAELAQAKPGEEKAPSDDELRLAADIVASFSDSEAAHVYHRLTGVALGSVTDVIEI